MENFKQIAEDCLSGKLSGTFILRDGSKVNSNHLKKLNPSKHLMCSYSLGECWISDNGNAYGETGYLHTASIINFIPDTETNILTPDLFEMIKDAGIKYNASKNRIQCIGGDNFRKMVDELNRNEIFEAGAIWMYHNFDKFIKK